jgi:hypothetical protein
MVKIPSRKLSGTKKKIPSRKFPKSQRKIASRKFAKPSAAAHEKPAAPLRSVRPADEKSRQDRLATLQGQLKSLKPASHL